VLTLVLAIAAVVPSGAPVCVVPDGTRVRLELALTDEEKQLGLMFRDSLPADRGMLFIFEADGPLQFWMKNTFIPLDFVWVSASGQVVDVRANVPPCRADPCPGYDSSKPARAVLEVNSAFAAAHGVRPGVQLRFENVPGFPVSEVKR
jgi:uncharacterized membrane protein (UPF0127 family)